MKKLILIGLGLFVVLLLQGCITTQATSYIANSVCETDTFKQELMKIEIDRATYPHVVRVECNAALK